MSLRSKLFVSFVAIGIVPALLLAAVVYSISAGAQERMAEDSLHAFRSGVDSMVKGELARLGMVGAIFMKDPGLEDAISNYDAAFFENLASRMSPSDYLVVQDASGKLIYTSLGKREGMPPYAPEAFVAASHPNGVTAPSAALPGRVDMRGRFEARAADGSTIGHVYIGGFVFGFPFVDGVKTAFGIECTIFRGEERIYTTLISNGQRAIGTRMTNSAVIEAVLNRGDIFDSTNSILGNLYNTLYWPIIDAVGKNVGMYFIGLPMTVIENAKTSLLRTVTAALAIVVALILIMARFTVTPITRTLSRIIDGLGLNSRLVNDAASEIRESSQMIAEGAGTQAAAQEETSSVLGQMATMTRQNADNTARTNQTNRSTNQRIMEGAELVGSMTASMEAINDSANRISNIINTIEEIAFQTNLLALNAAVEAARAGEAGKGFAIVADEVRNLAQRSAQAARDTNELITATVDRVRNGSAVAENVQRSFKDIEEGSSTVSRLIGDITNATNEQAQGMEQVTIAISRMKEVTRDNAGSSGHAAKAAAELSDAASVLNGMVEELTALVEGRSADGAVGPAMTKPRVDVRLLPMP